jgi:hypothetical protein
MAQMSLSDVLVQLRKELSDAQEKAKDEDLTLAVRDIEVELQVAITKEGEGKVAFKVWLLKARPGRTRHQQPTRSGCARSAGAGGRQPQRLGPSAFKQARAQIAALGLACGTRQIVGRDPDMTGCGLRAPPLTQSRGICF